MDKVKGIELDENLFEYVKDVIIQSLKQPKKD